MDQESLKRLVKEHNSKYNKHLTPELDMTSLVLKAHLFLEDMLYEIILLQCKTPNALNGIQFSFNHKLKLAEALYGAHFYNFDASLPVWPVLEALNKLRNELAHRIDSPKLEDKIVNFLRASEEHLKIEKTSRPLDEILCDSNALTGRMRNVLLYLLGCLGFMHGLIYLNQPEKFLASLFAEINLTTSAKRIIVPDEYEC